MSTEQSSQNVPNMLSQVSFDVFNVFLLELFKLFVLLDHRSRFKNGSAFYGNDTRND